MFFNLKSYEYHLKLEQIKENNPSAGDLGQDHCISCCFCCWVRPCGLCKENVSEIANYLNITVKELFNKYLVIDKIRGQYVILPRRYEQEDIAGSYIPDDRTYDYDTPCVFLDYENRKCSIHDVKPIDGRKLECWSENKNYKISIWRKEEIMNIFDWDGNE